MHLDLSSVECIVSPKEYYKKYLVPVYTYFFIKSDVVAFLQGDVFTTKYRNTSHKIAISELSILTH